METEGYTLATTTINAFELFYGVYKSKKHEKNLASTKTMLKRLIILKTELTSAQNAGRIYTELEKQGPTHRIKRHHDRRNHPNQRIQSSHKKH